MGWEVGGGRLGGGVLHCVFNRGLPGMCVCVCVGGVHCVEQATVRCVCVWGGGGCIVLNRGLPGVGVDVCVWGGGGAGCILLNRGLSGVGVNVCVGGGGVHCVEQATVRCVCGGGGALC